jgi:hypothetical protein
VSRKHKKKHHVAHQSSTAISGDRAANERYRTDLTPDWYLHDSSLLPFGSTLWWEQKGREGGGNKD